MERREGSQYANTNAGRSMSDAIIVFAAQFVYVLLLGLQSLNVNHDHRAAAAGTSTMLGMLGFHLTGTIAAAKGDTWSWVWWAFVAAGPIGVVSSMALHKRLRNRK